MINFSNSNSNDQLLPYLDRVNYDYVLKIDDDTYTNIDRHILIVIISCMVINQDRPLLLTGF
jgi:hypothetical protein